MVILNKECYVVAADFSIIKFMPRHLDMHNRVFGFIEFPYMDYFNGDQLVETYEEAERIALSRLNEQIAWTESRLIELKTRRQAYDKAS